MLYAWCPWYCHFTSLVDRTVFEKSTSSSPKSFFLRKMDAKFITQGSLFLQYSTPKSFREDCDSIRALRKRFNTERLHIELGCMAWKQNNASQFGPFWNVCIHAFHQPGTKFFALIFWKNIDICQVRKGSFIRDESGKSNLARAALS